MFISKKDQKLVSDALNMKGRSLWQDAWLRFKHNKAAMTSVFLLSMIILFSIIVPMIAPHHYAATNWNYVLSPPSIEQGYWMGSDALGRDVLARVAVGGRISLLVGILGALMAVTVGTIYGSISGFFGGIVDTIMMRIVDIINAFPFMFFVILLITIFGRRIEFIFIAIGLFSWVDVARIVRGQTLSLKQKEFIDAAFVSGLKNRQIIFRHIIPNVLGIVVIYASLMVPTMILFESFLSFLGLGVQEPMTSWGALLQEGAQNMQVALWQLIFPSLFLITTLFSFNFIGDGLRDALDPKDR
ncbi:oligopeptide ABC transporter permease OppC [Neisseriaceae bacterium PsAf]|nr:oligopeptide ABC transporter permease OppC [Neisseriaceae bacterium PsAf]MCV2503601.1 oligopeptide ABC transporter permease OppC [Neisseriaceae bacterium]